jgi:hypothetical protein
VAGVAVKVYLMKERIQLDERIDRKVERVSCEEVAQAAKNQSRLLAIHNGKGMERAYPFSCRLKIA